MVGGRSNDRAEEAVGVENGTERIGPEGQVIYMERKLNVKKTAFYMNLSSLFKIIFLPAVLSLFACHSVPIKMASSILELPEPSYRIKVSRNVMIPMEDGVRLAADIYHPHTTGAFPVILIRTPYNKRNREYGYKIFGGLFASQGYIIVIQDVRGKFESEGDFYPIINDLDRVIQ